MQRRSLVSSRIACPMESALPPMPTCCDHIDQLQNKKKQEIKKIGVKQANDLSQEWKIVPVQFKSWFQKGAFWM